MRKILSNNGCLEVVSTFCLAPAADGLVEAVIVVLLSCSFQAVCASAQKSHRFLENFSDADSKDCLRYITLLIVYPARAVDTKAGAARKAEVLRGL